MTNTTTPIPPNVNALLRGLRQRIRWYVLLEGVAIAVLWLGIAFWVGLALDYLPVLVGASEMPRAARTILLILISAGLLYIVYRWILKRTFVRLANHSLALLLERYYPEFDDSLVTTVELAGRVDESFQRSMLDRTVASAGDRTRNVRFARIFNRGRLLRSLAGATLMMLSIVLFAVMAREAFATWTSRLLLLSDDNWPRRAFLEVLELEDGHLTVAEGSDVTVRVRADATRPTPPPDRCAIAYRLDGGDYGRVNMSRDGEARDGHQYYRFDGKPFMGMLEGVTFDVIGFDYRVRDMRIDVVKSPSVAEVQIHSQPPEYTGNTPRTERWQPGLSRPVGSAIDFRVKATKPLRRVEIEDLETAVTRTIDFEEGSQNHEFEFSEPSMRRSLSFQITLLDTDDIPSQRPYRLTVGVNEDLAPQVDVVLKGIGSAITPQARLPVLGHIDEDYGIDRCWFQVDGANDDTSRQIEFEPQAGGQVDNTLDLRRERSKEDESWQLEPGTQVLFSVRANDFYDLADGSNMGQSEEFTLRVVTPDELLALLEAKELNLKQLFEHVIAETTSTRDSLLRLQSEMNQEDSSAEREPGDPEDSRERIRSLRLLRVQRADQQADKSQQEVTGIAVSFSDIRSELTNNRVDTEERKIRLQQQIIEPLSRIAEDSFPGWQATLDALHSNLEADSADTAHARNAVNQANKILLELEDVLAKMIELETYNELVDLVRNILREQENLVEKTKEERRQKARSLFE